MLLPLIAVGSLALALLSEQWEPTVFLHGSSNLFGTFREGHHGLIYLSDPRRTPRRKTQAQSIAGGPFGGFLYEVEILHGKHFDPLNDPVAKEIALQVIGPGPSGYRSEEERLAMIHYDHAPKLAKLATPLGYTHFDIWEPAARTWSTAIARPDLIKITKIHDVRARPIEPWQLTFAEFTAQALPTRAITSKTASFEDYLAQRGIDPSEVASEYEEASYIGGTVFARPSRTSREMGKLKSLERKVNARTALLKEYQQDVPDIITQTELDLTRGDDIALARTTHKRAIRRAIRDGERVPGHVLQEYRAMTSQGR